ncbi:MAG: histidinol-phosphatase HisJ family protein [Clostridia bacterium]|nr:histidinol-phosphatase HisJ family protein [Clostridia bacterium]
MSEFILDLHTHSTHSFDGKNSLKEMLEAARERGFLFYGASEHYNYDLIALDPSQQAEVGMDEPAYWHDARHLQEDYAGVLNVLVGVEFGYTDHPLAVSVYQDAVERYQPDFIINSAHSKNGRDFYLELHNGDRKGGAYKGGRTKRELYSDYLQVVRQSLDAPYPYDVVGHFGYVTRYVDFGNITMAEFGEEIDDILKTVIRKDKILELNTSNGGKTDEVGVPSAEMLRRYYELGGRKVTFGSDAHSISRLAEKWEEAKKLLNEIGFTHLTVPCRGEEIQLPL